MLGSMFVSCRQDNLVWVSFDDDFVVYHRPSGKTHFLNEASKVLLTELLDDARDLPSILDAFATADSEDHSEEYVRQMKGMLGRLEDLGLIQSA